VPLDVADKAVERGVAVLILTGWALKMPAHRLERHQYLLKPVRPAELLTAVQQALRPRQDDADVIPFPKAE